MHLRLKVLSLVAALLLVAASLAAQDGLTVGGATCLMGPSPGSVQIPVYIRDTSGTPLGIDMFASAPIQAFGFRVVVSPADAVDVGAVTVVKAGIARLASISESLTSDPVTSSFTYAVAFNRATSPLRFTSNARPPGDQVATITIPIPIKLRATTINLTVDMAILANQTASITETVAKGTLRTNDGCITICNPVAITTQPQTQTIAYGYSATFTAAASGTSPAFQWYSGSTPIAGATSATYTTPPIKYATTYWVRVTNGCSTVDSDKATITVTYPTLTVPYKEPAVPWGKEYWCNVRLNPASPIAVGVNTSAMSGFSIPANETSWYYLEERGKTVGTYPITVWADFGSGGRTSDSYTLTVLPFQFTLTPETKSIQIGAKQYYSIVFADNSYLLKNPIAFSIASSNTGVATVYPSSVTIDTGHASGTFAATGLSLGQSTITATLPPEIGGTQSVTLNVVPPCTPLSIATQPKSGQAYLGDSAVLSVALAAWPWPDSPVRFEWFEGSAPDTSKSVAVFDSPAPFTTPPLTATTSYWARVSTYCSSVDSATATIAVVDKQFTVTCPSTMIPGTTTSGRITIRPAPPSLNLTSSTPSVATVPAAIAVPAVPEFTTALVDFPVSAAAAGSSTINAAVPGDGSRACVVTVANPTITLTPSAASATAGKTQTFTVTINPIVPSAATTIALASSSIAVATVPGSVSIPANTSSVTFNASAKTAGSATITATLPANFGSGKATAALTVTAACTAAAITTQPSATSIAAGSTATLRVTATGSDLHYQWYEGTAPATTKPVGTDSSALTTPALTATTNYWVKVSNSCSTVNSATATITVTATGVSMSTSTTTVPVGTKVAYTLSLSAPLTTATTITLSSSNTAVATVPSTASIGAGATSTSFSASTLAPGTATITATMPPERGGGKATSAITVSPLAFTLAPATATINVGTTQLMTVTLASAYPAAMTIALSSNNKPSATVPATVGIAASASSVSFNVTAVAPGTATITATLPANVGGQAKSATITVSTACLPPAAPVPSVLGTTQSRVPYTVAWNAIPGAVRYLIQESTKSDFSTTVTAREITGTSMEFTNVVAQAPAVNYYYRVRSIKDCNVALGSFSSAVTTIVNPDPVAEAATSDGLDGSVSTVGRGSTTFVVHVDSPPPKSALAITYTVTTSASFLTASPSSGTMPAGGVDITITANAKGLPVGSTTGTVTVAASTGAILAAVPVSLSVITPVKPVPRDKPDAHSLIVPAVAHVDTPTTRFVSDVRLANVGAVPITYLITYTPAGADGTTIGRQTSIVVAAGETVALNDIVRLWFGESANSGALEIRALTAGVDDRSTIVTSRTYAKGTSGTFGQFIPGVGPELFVGKGRTLSIQHVSQSSTYRTNLGFVEGSGEEATVRVRVYDAAGTKVDEFTLDPPLMRSEFRQINKVLESRRLTVSDGVIEVDVLSDHGTVTAYASVLDNRTNDPFLVTPVEVSNVKSTRYVVPGVADLRSGGMSWRTDVRVYNSSWSPVNATMTYYPDNAPASPVSKPLALNPREVKVLDNVLASAFGVKSDTKGAIHITTAVTSALVVTTRTYDYRATGTYGQFIPAVTAADAIGAGDRPIQLLQLEQSPRYRTNVGITEVSGNTAFVEVTAYIPGETATKPVPLELKPNQALQLSRILTQFTAKDAYNARISVKVTGGAGKVTAYASVVDAKTSDPTYVPAQ